MHRHLAAALLAGAAAAARLAAHPSASLVMDAAGNVYYSDLERVWRLAPDGGKTVVVEGVHTHELWLDASGALYGEHLWYEGEATDRWGHRVWRRDPGGAVSDVYPARPGLRTDTSFVRDAAGNQFWSEARRQGGAAIRRKSPFGAISTIYEGDVGRLGWMAADADGTLFFTAGGDRRRATGKLYRLSATGRLDLLTAELHEPRLRDVIRRSFHDVYGVWPDHAGGAYVALLGARRVLHVDRRGAVTEAARSRAPWAPTGGLRAPDGALWILENGVGNAVRVRRLAADGSERVF